MQPTQEQTADGRHAGTLVLLTDACGESEEIDEPEEEEGALELQRPEHNVGCRGEQSMEQQMGERINVRSKSARRIIAHMHASTGRLPSSMGDGMAGPPQDNQNHSTNRITPRPTHQIRLS